MPRAKNTITKTFTFQGKRYYVTGKTNAEVVEAMRRRKDELIELSQQEQRLRVSEWAYKAVETYKVNQKPVTRKKYLQRMQCCILSQIGNKYLDEVTPLDCQEILNRQAGKSKTQINEVAQTLKFIFYMARVNGKIEADPATDIIKPVGTKVSRRSLTEKELEHFLKVSEYNSRFLLYKLMLYCGCRPSEAIAAKGSDIEVINGQPVLHIRGTKTHNAPRTVLLPYDLYTLVKDTPLNAPISPNDAGKPHDDSSYKRLNKALYRALNISMGCKVYRNQLQPPYPLADDLVPYCFRHTYCTNLLRQNIDPRMSQYMMGHADLDMTGYYTHITTDMVVQYGQQMKRSGTTESVESTAFGTTE